MREVADYYGHHGSANDRMLAYYLLGCVYRDMHEAPMALEYYNKATEQADTTAADYAMSLFEDVFTDYVAITDDVVYIINKYIDI